MDNRPIGIFDSGVGGLTVLAAMQDHLPLESTIYLGDTARVPYGTRSADAVIRYARNNTMTLLKRTDVKMLVVACNTASAVALDALQASLPIPVVGVIEPGAKAALSASRGGSILILGTAGTIRSQAYENCMQALGHTGKIVSRPCPLLVPLVEEGWTHGDIPKQIIERYFEDIPDDLDTVVLGCTHYPLLREVIQGALPAHVVVVDGGVATAEEVNRHLRETDAFSSLPHATHSILVTDAPEQMSTLSSRFLGKEIKREAVELVNVVMGAVDETHDPH
jgi:glutamate racemase